ncbi:MAG: hypothetical protein KJO31_08265 [Gammaproteobacteria bacterium]|nr:hypothetical protein [Gammaproteobacteria bacterium]
MRVVCVGDCGIDRYLPTGKHYVGGITANFARHARSLFPAADEIAVIAPLGNDPEATAVRSAFASSGIDCHFCELDGATPVQYINVREDGEKEFLRYEEGVLRNFELDAPEIELIADSDVLVAPAYLQIARLFDGLMQIRTNGTICIDFADFAQHPDFELLERHLESIDVSFFGLSGNDEETIEKLAAMARAQDKLIVVTLGGGGSIAFQRKRRYEQQALPVDQVIDTTGAGDAYAAAFLSRYCHGAGINEAMAAGAARAASVVQRPGAF